MGSLRAVLYFPEDGRIERFQQHVREQARILLGDDLAKVEKFQSSLKDGLDLRETLRNWHTGDVYVRELPATRGSVEVVVFLFDVPANPHRYTWHSTWYAEHGEESTLSFFATPFLDNMVGPGIGQALYGGCSFIFPPRSIPDIWTDDRLRFTQTLEERLLGGALLHSQERRVVLLPHRLPRFAGRRMARKMGRQIVYIPLGRFFLCDGGSAAQISLFSTARRCARTQRAIFAHSADSEFAGILTRGVDLSTFLSFVQITGIVPQRKGFPLRIIDPHVHVWKNDPAFPWPAENAKPPSEDRTAEDLLALMDAHGVEKTVLVQVIHYRWDNSYVADVIKRYPDKFMGVGRVNPEDPAAADHVSMWTEEHGLHGVRLSPARDASEDWFTSSAMDPIFARAQDLGIPMLILTGPKRLPDLARLLDKYPELDTVIDHMADVHPDDSEGRKLLADMARYPRVYVKISHTWSISQNGYPWTDTHGLVQEVYQNFGAQRISWGTDWPVCLGKAEYGQTLSAVRDEMKFFSPEDLEWVLGKTALTLWNFGEK